MMNSTETSLTMENDVYAVSNLQQTAFAMIERCGDAAENRRVIRSELLSDAAVQQEGVVAFLMEENERRRRWVDRLLRLVWLNYEEIGLGAPEIDPWNSVAANEWMGDSMFVLDNLDVLSMFQLTQSLNKVLRWLEVDNFLRECATGHNTYHSFRRYFSSSLGLDKARSDECDSAAVKRKVDQWRDATNPEVADEVDHELIRLISKCLPNVFELSESDSNPFFQHEGDVHEDVLEYEQLYNLLGFLRSNWGDLNALSRPHVVSFFETTIRGLGGLMSAFHLTGHPILMYMGLELGHGLSYAFFECKSDTGDIAEGLPCIPDRSVDVSRMRRFGSGNNKPRTSSASREGTGTSAAVLATNQLEYRTLSDLSGLCFYTNVADRVLDMSIADVGGFATGFIPREFQQDQNGTIAGSSTYSLGAEGDSAYEYMVKSAFQLRGRDKLKNQWVQSFAKIVHTFFHDETGLGATDQRFKALLYGPVEPADQDHWTDGGTTKLGTVKSPYTVVDQLSIRANHAAQETVVGREEEMHHLACFSGGMMVMVSQLPEMDESLRSEIKRMGEKITESCVAQYLLSPTGIAPERSSYLGGQMKVLVSTAWIRPEILESVKWEWDATKKIKYRNLAWQAASAILANSRVPKGLCPLNSSESSTVEKSKGASCRQDTWILAETLKYLRLVFSSETEFRETVQPAYNISHLRNVTRSAVANLTRRNASASNYSSKHIPSVSLEETRAQLNPNGLNATYWGSRAAAFMRARYFPKRVDRDAIRFGSVKEVMALMENNASRFDMGGTAVFPGVVFTTEAHPLPQTEEANAICSPAASTP